VRQGFEGVANFENSKVIRQQDLWENKKQKRPNVIYIEKALHQQVEGMLVLYTKDTVCTAEDRKILRPIYNRGIDT